MITDDALSQILKWTGWATWFAVGFPVAVDIGHSANGQMPVPVWWILAFVAFAPAFAVSSARSSHSLLRALHIPALTVATVSPLVLIGFYPECFAGALLVLVAWQVAIQLDTRWALIWVATQSMLLSVIVINNSPNSSGISSSFIFTVFQLFAFCTAYLTRREIGARQELLRSNSELRATQLLLSHSTRIGERVRISRELHDVLGHDLTALSLHLEIARNTQNKQQDVEKAQRLAKGLLVKVREVVSLMRSDDEMRILPFLREMASDEPKLKVHFDADEAVDSLDSERAHTLLRCVQEAITNARLHSGAKNLWLEIRHLGDRVVAQARDDGCGIDKMHCNGHGLTGIAERLKEFGGQMQVDSAPGKGFSLQVELPLKC